ncbi:MAG: ankyrin repeat domain-containing protein [Sideroxydans sp.]|nr:ankyrin repeat domain-containing protein [Sideroxydans sp.]
MRRLCVFITASLFSLTSSAADVAAETQVPSFQSLCEKISQDLDSNSSPDSNVCKAASSVQGGSANSIIVVSKILRRKEEYRKGWVGAAIILATNATLKLPAESSANLKTLLIDQNFASRKSTGEFTFCELPIDEAKGLYQRFADEKLSPVALYETSRCNVAMKEDYRLHDAAAKNDIPAMKRLLSEGAKVNVTSDHIDDGLFIQGMTPLHFATLNGHAEAIKLLVEHGANVNAGGPNDAPSIQSVDFKKHKEVVELLLSLGADINAVDADGNTALHSACFFGYKLEEVKFLLSKGANANLKNSEGKTPAMLTDDKKIKALLKKSSGKV